MKYKLKEHVSDEMLIACGFNIISFKCLNAKGAYKVVDDKSGAEIYIPRFNSIYGENIIQYASLRYDDEVLEEHIEDLIELNYVEVVDERWKRKNEK